MDNKKLILKKIPLYDLLTLFEHLYQSGADYVDIMGIMKDVKDQDEILVSVLDEYMNTGRDEAMAEESFTEMDGVANIVEEPGPPPPGMKMTENRLNSLLDESV